MFRLNTRSKHLIISCKRNVKCKKGKSIKTVFFDAVHLALWKITQHCVSQKARSFKTAQIFSFAYLPTYRLSGPVWKATKPDVNWHHKLPKKFTCREEQKIWYLISFNKESATTMLWSKSNMRAFWTKFPECQPVFIKKNFKYR